MKKRSVIIGISILTGLVSSVLFRKNRHLPDKKPCFVGEWSYTAHNQDRIVLSLSEEYVFMLNGKTEKVTVVELSPTRLVLLDSMGYHLLFQQRDGACFFYDEAEDQEYLLTQMS